MTSFKFLALTLQLLAVVAQDAPVPVVLWHGMGDSAAGMIGIANILKDNIPDVYVYRIMIGNNIIVDTESGFFRDTNRQVREVCQMIQEDPELQNGYNAWIFAGRTISQSCCTKMSPASNEELDNFWSPASGSLWIPQLPWRNGPLL